MTEPLDRYLDDFGERLVEAGESRAPHRRRPAALAVAVIVVVATLVVVLASGSGDRLDPVAEARAALAPHGEIVYMKTTSGILGENGDFLTPQTNEQWSTATPRRWRQVTTTAQPLATVAEAGPVAGGHEVAYARGAQRTYVPELDTLDVITGYSDHRRAAMAPSLLGTGSGDVAADLRALLARHDVADEGERRVDGRTVRRLTGVVAVQGEPVGTRQRFVYDVDPVTFAPVEMTEIFDLPHAKGPSTRVRIHVEAYRRIPLNATTAKLLRIRTTPRTRVTTHTLTELEGLTSTSACPGHKDGKRVCAMRRGTGPASTHSGARPARPAP